MTNRHILDRAITILGFAFLAFLVGFILTEVVRGQEPRPATSSSPAGALAPSEVETLRIKNLQLDLQVTYMQVGQLQQAYTQLQAHTKEVEATLAKELVHIKAAHAEWGDPSALDFDSTTVTFHKKGPAPAPTAVPVPAKKETKK